jgi:para-aminobenzoate synthetase
VSVPVPSSLALRVRRLDAFPDPERAFVHLYGDRDRAFWLDSSSGGEHGRFSFLGAADGPLAATVSCDVGSGVVRVERAGGVETRRESVFDYLGAELRRLGPPRRHGPAPPFAFDGGFVGYLGYELKADCDGERAHAASTPDACLLFADRVVAFDALERRAYLLCLCEPGGEEEAERWLAATARRLAALPALPEPGPGAGGGISPADFAPRRSRRRYLADVEEARRRLFAGETYEVCLTDTLRGPAPADPLELYRALRRVNPAPYASFLRFGPLAVLSSSPERFLGVDRERRVEARPVKGTVRRGADPAEDARLAAWLREDPKTRAENVTIVDLVRNDLGRVCETGSVEVPELMRVESFETVHQLVSVMRGRLREDVDAAACARACFPPGSMTGAPKLRTMRIIDELEGAARGVYSGAIGYFGLGGGCETAVTIRTIVTDGGTATVGAGGAIVLDSDPEREYEEMLLKAAAPLRAFAPEAEPASISLPDQRRGAATAPPASVPDLQS